MNRLVGVAVVLLAVSCREEPKALCAPGSTQACVCPGGGQGAQSCASDGARWEACTCAASAQPAAVAATASGAADPSAKSPSTDEDSSPPVDFEADGPKRYTLTIVSADVAPSKPDGKPWDAGNGAPDLVVSVRVDGAGAGTVTSSKAENKTTHTWNQSGSVTINRGDRLVVNVIDKDAFADDFVATIAHQFTKPGKVTLSGKAVNSLVLDIKAAK